MSEAAVNLILSLYPAGDPDWVQLIHDDDMWAAQVEAWSSFFHLDFECVWHHFGGERHYAGLDGLRAFRTPGSGRAHPGSDSPAATWQWLRVRFTAVSWSGSSVASVR